MQLEDGEIEDNTDDEIDPYTPLERPNLNSELKQEQEYESDKESVSNCLSFSEDSDEDMQPKKAKMRRVIIPPKRQAKRNKYTVWCRDPNEHLTDFLSQSGILNPEKDRSVENYIVPHADRKRKVPVRQHLQFESAKLEPIFLKPLESSELSTFECLAREICDNLSEDNYELVLRIVVICGKEKAIELYNRTMKIESDGGLLIANKSRRRTSGGVFILLVRSNKSITRNQKNEIFEESVEKSKKSKIKQRKKQRQRNYQEWLEQMNYEKEVESGQEELNNPPPSPEPHCPEPLPELRLRRDILSYNDLNLHQSTDSEDTESVQNAQLTKKESIFDFHCLPADSEDAKKSPLKTAMNTSPQKDASQSARDVIEYDDLCSMELIYD